MMMLLHIVLLQGEKCLLITQHVKIPFNHECGEEPPAEKMESGFMFVFPSLLMCSASRPGGYCFENPLLHGDVHT